MRLWSALRRLCLGERKIALQEQQRARERPVASAVPVVPVCPSCSALLPKLPQRKTRCKACGEFMFVKYTPDNPVRRLMTAAQAAQAEAMWKAKGEQDHAEREGAIYGLPSLPKDPAVRRAYFLMHTEEKLAELASKGSRSVQIAGGDANDCDACLRMNGVILSTTASATDVVPQDCKHLSEGRATCSLYLSGWIKRPDGTGYVDRLR